MGEKNPSDNTANSSLNTESESTDSDENTSEEGEDDSPTEEELKRLRKYRSLTGSLRYARNVSDSKLLKLYAIVFVLVGTYITILWILAMIVWISRLQDAVTVSVLIAIPGLNLTYIVIIFLLMLPLYVPMRIYREKMKKDIGVEKPDWVTRLARKILFWK